MKQYVKDLEDKVLYYDSLLAYVEVSPSPEFFEDIVNDMKYMLLIIQAFERREDEHEQQVIARLDYLRSLPKPDYDAHQ